MMARPLQRHRGLIVTNMVALVLLLAVLFVFGWREAVTFGLVALILLDLMVLIRGRPTRPQDDREE
jgi:uncharacterized membrane protein YgaE (UPF0421/DUF939 family)